MMMMMMMMREEEEEEVVVQGSHLREKTAFLRKKRAGYANLKMPCVYCTQKTMTSHIKMRLVFSFFCTRQRKFVEHLPWV